jgi:hypothetical protein
MKVIAYYALHYGKEWLKWSMKSIRPFVDDIYVFYTATPSFGHSTYLTNPDTMDELHDIAKEFGVNWYNYKAKFGWEGDHRDHAVNYLMDEVGSDVVMAVDADEIWHPDYLEYSLDWVKHESYRHYRAWFIHFWRSVRWICLDPAMPVRFHRKSYVYPTDTYIPRPDPYYCVYHMGYAQSPSIINYKQDIHGHKGEWRDGWFDQKFMPWKPGSGIFDVHPTNVDFWKPELFKDGDGVFHKLISDHPYYSKEIIE